LGVNVNLFAPSLGLGAPSTQWWTQLSSAIAGGLTFATGLTLLLTPCMLVLGGRFERRQPPGSDPGGIDRAGQEHDIRPGGAAGV